MSLGGKSLIMSPVAILAALGIDQRRALYAAANTLRNRWQDVLNIPGQGRQYGRHRASKPGDPPAPDIGTLRSSIAVVWQGPSEIRVGTNLDYGRFLEYGTRFIEPRPHARPAKDLALDEMNAIMGSKARGG